MRRCIDIIVSATALVALSPLLVFIALLIGILDGSPVVFCQTRAGYRGVPFRMIKFRTMRLNAEKSGGTLTYRKDPRITPLGRFLRRAKLDELPQFVNVLRGEMTLIGPRPEVLDWAARYTAGQRAVFDAKPGLSDPVQILFRNEHEYLSSESEYEKLVAVKNRKQIEYIRSRTPASDMATAMRTFLVIFKTKPSAEELAVYNAIRSPHLMEASAKVDQPAKSA